jgi:hypothetical protein
MYMQRLLVIPVILLAAFLIVGTGCAEMEAGNTVRVTFAVR